MSTWTQNFVLFNSDCVSCQKLKDVESIVKITELNGEDLVKDYSDVIERMLGSKMKSVKVRTPRKLQPNCAVEGDGGQCRTLAAETDKEQLVDKKQTVARQQY